MTEKTVALITADQLRTIMPQLPMGKVAEYFPHLEKALEKFEINTPRRVSAFLAQLAHESAQLRYFEEIASGAAYEGRKDLGNVNPGDGKRYKGRGPIQLTGRANYRKYGNILGIDLEGNPELAATPAVGFLVAGLFWQLNKLNELADIEKFETITRRINGGTNGLLDRQKYYTTAKKILGVK